MRTRASRATGTYQPSAGQTAMLTTVNLQRHLEHNDSLSSISDSGSTVNDDDGDTVMGDDEERPQTPPRFGAYNPGSVVLTPNKNKPRGQGHEQPTNEDGVNHDNTGVNTRVEFVRDPSVAPSEPDDPENDPGSQKRLVFKKEPFVYVIPARSPSEESSTPEPQAGPSDSRTGPEWDGVYTSEWNDTVHWYRNNNGIFVRDGSLPPECGYSHRFPKELQPPRADAVDLPRAESPPEQKPPRRLERMDTILVINDKKTPRRSQRLRAARRLPTVREQPAIGRRNPSPRKKAVPFTALRRSERIRNKAKAPF